MNHHKHDTKTAHCFNVNHIIHEKLKLLGLLRLSKICFQTLGKRIENTHNAVPSRKNIQALFVFNRCKLFIWSSSSQILSLIKQFVKICVAHNSHSEFFSKDFSNVVNGNDLFVNMTRTNVVILSVCMARMNVRPCLDKICAMFEKLKNLAGQHIAVKSFHIESSATSQRHAF